MISVFGSHITHDEVMHVEKCLRSQWLGMGKYVDRFEKEFAADLGVDDVVMVDNCSNALYMAVVLLNLPKGSKIAVPSYTWVSCAHAIVLAGHVPVFVDVDYNTMCVRAEDIKGTGADAAIVVHYAGASADMDPILDLSIPIIEDAAHAVRSTYNGKRCGTIGDIGVFSFDSTKNLATCDGGALCASRATMNRARTMRYCGVGKSGFEASAEHAHGKWWEYDIREHFIRMTPNNVSAAIGIGQLERLNGLQKRRQEIWNMYNRGLANQAWITRPVSSQHGEHSYFTYAIRVPHRDELAHFLYDNGVYTTLRFHPLHMNKIYNQTSTRLPNTERLNEHALSLPLHPRLFDAEVAKVIGLLKQFGNDRGL